MTEGRPQDQRDGAQPTYEVHPAITGFTNAIENFAEYISRHWAGMINLLLLAYVAMPFLAPVFMQVGWTFPARAIYAIYTPACHQLPERSYFLFGESAVYDEHALQASGVELSDNLLLRRQYIGDEVHGWKVAICERDVAIYGAMFLTGLIFALASFRFPQLSWKLFLLFLIPIGLDGGLQLIGLHQSNWLYRTITGVIFGIGVIWLIYPYLAKSMKSTVKPGGAKGNDS